MAPARERAPGQAPAEQGRAPVVLAQEALAAVERPEVALAAGPVAAGNKN
jgi:hypothetical protein